MGKFIDLTGRQFGRLTVVKKSNFTKNNRIYWECKCSCGKESLASSKHLSDGHTKSCGCYRYEFSKLFLSKGETHSRLYGIWYNMVARCKNINEDAYRHYGGRGIDVCEEWNNDFISFKEWSINNGYQSNLTIDRIDNNGNYEPSNCRWATRKEQSNNTRTNVFITFNGKTLTATQWAEIVPIKALTIMARVRYGWSPKDILTRPLHKRLVESK